MPIYNPHGKYWVKLHHLGEERLVEIDDRMPCTAKGHLLLPNTVDPFEIWPSLLSKAIMKLYSYQWTYKDNLESEVGDASIVHALTGLLPEKFDMSNFATEKWPIVKQFLSDDYYFNKKGYVCGYCTTNYTPVLPSISKFINQEDKAGSEAADPNAPGLSGSRALLRYKRLSNMAISVTTGKKFKDCKERPTNVVKGFGYALMDSFENEGFDMTYSIREDYDMYIEKNSIYSVEKKRKRRAIATDDQKKRVKDSDTMSRRSSRISHRQLRKFQFVKVKSSVVKIPAINAVCPFTNEEITMAKKCIINKLERRPDYDKKRFDQESKKGEQEVKEISNTNEKHEKEEKNSEMSKQEEGEEENQVFIDPKPRATGGLWMDVNDMVHSFQYLLIFHNPTSYASKVCHQDLWKNSNEFFIPNENKICLKVITAEEEKAVEEGKEPIVDNDPDKSKMLITFAPNGCLFKEEEPATNYSCTIPSLNIKLTNYLASKLIMLKDVDKELIFQPNIIAPFGYTLWVIGNFPSISVLPELEYLCTPEKGFVKKEAEIDFPAIRERRYYVVFRGNFNCTEEKTDLILKVDVTDRYLLQCMRFYIINRVNVEPDMDKVKAAELSREDITEINHNTLFSLGPGNYSILGDLIAPYNTEPGKIKISLVTNPDIAEFVDIPLEEQAEYGDLYVPYKYGIVFRERIFVGGETPVSIHVRVRKGGYAKPPPPKEEKKTSKKEPEEKPIAPPEVEFEAPRRIRLEIFQDGETIYDKMSYNHATIPNIKLRKTEVTEAGKVNSYIIQCGFDISDWPECVNVDEGTEEVGWVIKVVSPESVSIVKDTEKADREQKIKESWETNEPGRASRARQSRERYLILQKKLRGEQLTEEEEELLKNPLAKKEEEKKVAGKKAPVKKEVKKGKGEPEKKEEDINQLLDLEKPLPEPDDHINIELNKYLTHAKKDRYILIKDTRHKARKRTEQEVEQIGQKHEIETQNFDKYYKEVEEKEEERKKEREDKKANYQQGLKADLDEGIAQYKEIMVKRGEYKEVLIIRKEKEDELRKMIASDKIDLQVILKVRVSNLRS